MIDSAHGLDRGSALNIRFILDAPARPENVGAAARALRTMGFTRLAIVGSGCHRSERARRVAHGAESLLDRALWFADLDAAVAGLDFVIATTVRRRGSRRRYHPPDAVAALLESRADALGEVGLLFGCEESGLSNRALEAADLISYIPMAVTQPSLNLGQAVMVYAYSLSSLTPSRNLNRAPGRDDPGQRDALIERARRLLGPDELGRDPKLDEWLADSLAALRGRDVRIAHRLLRSLERRLAEGGTGLG